MPVPISYVPRAKIKVSGKLVSSAPRDAEGGDQRCLSVKVFTNILMYPRLGFSRVNK